MSDEDKALWPIIYVRGYAMTRGEIDETTADPFCGFNLGSTVYRATADKKALPRKYVFESPLVRLGTDFGYQDVFDDGYDIVDADWQSGDDEPGIAKRSVVVFRYYEQASTLLGTGTTPKIDKFAEDLGALILRVRELVCARPGNKVRKSDFRCYLVAHSMGGLVCRAFLQNPKLGTPEARACVDKVFTFATPHNGIDVAGVNVPKFLSLNDISNFNREEMERYLALGEFNKSKKSDERRVDWLPEKAFPSERFFCLIGTNRSDYDAGMGLSRTFAGHGSDGLVRIENASVWGVDPQGKVSAPAATAHVYRSHSGYFGIVNSEEAYQNLVRFLFGDVRVDMWLDMTEVRLPPDVQKEKDAGEKVNALYQFETLASPRGKRWYLTRRVAEEDSVACRTLAQLTAPKQAWDNSIYLATVFLANRWKVNAKRKTLAYAVTIGVRVPDYEVEKVLWRDNHYEGGYLFRDAVVIEMTPPPKPGNDWKVEYAWQSRAGEKKALSLSPKALHGKVEISVDFEAPGAPGITGRLRFIAGGWNA